MGQDIESLLVYGATFSVDDVKPMMPFFGITESDIDDSFPEAFFNFCEVVKMTFPALFVDRASPYYDSDWESWTIYISIHEPQQTTLSANDLFSLITSTKGKDDYINFFIKIGQKAPEMELLALPHVW